MIPSRSYLFVPGSSERRLEKCLQLDADAVIVDLEDAVAPDDKDRARECLAAWLDGPASRCEKVIYIRVNTTLDGVVEEDMDVACHSRVSGVFLPKLEDSQVLAEAERAVMAREGVGALGPFVIVAMLETAKGVLDLRSIVDGSQRVATATLGVVDLMADLRASGPASGPVLEWAQGKVAFASRAAGLERPIDTVSPDIADVDGFLAATRRAKALGHFGKLVIHPSQIQYANAIFTPTPEEVASAERMLEAFADSVSAGNGALILDGRLIDRASVREAEDVIILASRYSD
jgi:citrate lyase subunit beta/citryl-CoA lyase